MTHTTTSLVFVYGTLRKGFKYHRLLHRAHFVGYAVTRKRYALYLAKYPCVIQGEHVSGITGEVYEVDQPTLESLDELEGHPHEYYREQVPVILEDEREVSAWLYFYPNPVGILESCGDYAKTLI